MHNVGVGAKSARADLVNFEQNNMGSSELSYNSNGDISIVAIDEMNFDKKVTFVKIDVEGFECEVVKGMRETISRALPYIMIEIRKDNFEEINSFLSSLGYWYIQIGCSINYLFIPMKTIQ